MASKTVVDEFPAHFDELHRYPVDGTVLCGGRWPASLLAEMEAADA